MKKRYLVFVLSFLVAVLSVSCVLNVALSLAAFVDYFVLDDSQSSFIDETTKDFICYPLVKADPSDPNIVAIGWAKKPNECTGSLTIPATVQKGTGGSAVTYYVKSIAQSGFRYCEFTSITIDADLEEIKAEAFYSCQNLTTFAMPEKCIHGIAPSTFMDCRNLTKIDMSETVSYISSRKEESGFLANNPYVIGDHAFSSCVKLKGFSFPTTLTEIGHSAFHNCTNIFGLFFPTSNGVNTISIGKYAFADCTNLAVVHFETNISNIDSYAFAQCDKLKIYYQGNPDTDPSDPMNSFDEYFRKKHVATNQISESADYVPIVYDISAMQMDDDHPGLIYIKQPGPIYYDGKVNSTFVLDSSTDEYITIFEWKTPTVASEDYNEETQVLTIPDTIDGSPVKKIAEQAFYDRDGDNDPLKGVIFNPSLVQICHEAFKENNILATIDFTNCVALKEIGHSAFEPKTSNQAFTGTLSLPHCLNYVGNKAFINFTKATSLELFDSTSEAAPNLKIIGNSAFQNFGSAVANSDKGTLDLLLPYSLMDGAAIQLEPTDLEASHACVGKYAFNNCQLIRTVTMQYHPTNPTTGGPNATTNKRTSFGEGVFGSCSYLLRFKGNKAVSRIGVGAFEKCPLLKELFLSTYLSASEENLFIWGYGEKNSLFFTDTDSDDVEYRDLVIYVDGSQGPTTRTRQEKSYVWNSDPKTYANEYAMGSSTYIYAKSASSKLRRDLVIGRLIVPTYYGVDYHTAGTIKYVNPYTGAVSNTPTDDYSNCVACIKKNNKYTVTRCYASGVTPIDMTSWSLDANIDTIGSSAFATLSSGNTTQKVILPNSITKIRDRAFYSVGTDGINIVTYKDGSNNEVTDNDATNVCFLPSAVTRVEAFAFFNNDFQKVTLPTALTMLGNTAFTVSMGKTATIETFGATGSSNYYTYADGGIYDTSTKTLLYYAAKGTGTLNLSSQTIYAIGARALANTTYTSFVLPSSVTTIYGGAFEGNTSVTSISGLTGLKYIGAPADTDDTEVWNNDTNFDIYDLAPKDFSKDYNSSNNFANRPYIYRWIDTYGSFARCTSLTTLNFSSFASSIKKIGYGAFEGCTNLSNMTGGSTTYTYYRYSNFEGLTKNNVQTQIAAQGAIKDQKTTGVLDLSGATNLKTLGRQAFKNCSNLYYAHLPILQDQNISKTDQAKFYVGIDYSTTNKETVGSWYSHATGASNAKKNIFEGTKITGTQGAVLVGESANFVNNMGGNYYDATVTVKSVFGSGLDNYDQNKISVVRYPADCLPSSCTYYYVRGEEYVNTDTASKANDSSTAAKYWIYIGDPNNHNYLLFETKAQIKAYFML